MYVVPVLTGAVPCTNTISHSLSVLPAVQLTVAPVVVMFDTCKLEGLEQAGATSNVTSSI